MVGLTSWQALKERAQIKPGQKVFIPAGSGGIGTFAIQLAKHLGAKVGTTTSTGNVELVRSLGANEVIDYKKQEFEEVLRDYDAVLGTVRGDALEKSLRILKPRSTVVSLIGPPDAAFARRIGGGVDPLARLVERSAGARRLQLRRRRRRVRAAHARALDRRTGVRRGRGDGCGERWDGGAGRAG